MIKVRKMTQGQKFIAGWGYLISPDCHNVLAMTIDKLVQAEREECARLVESRFQQARDSDYDLGFETARKVFAAAIRSRSDSTQ